MNNDVADSAKIIDQRKMEAIDSVAHPGADADSEQGDSIFSKLLLGLLTGKEDEFPNRLRGESGLDMFLENYQEPIIILSVTGVILKANPAFFRLYGWSQWELSNISLLNLVPEDSWPGLSEKLAHLGEGGQEKTHIGLKEDYIEFKARAKNGSVVSTECLLSASWESGERKIIAVLREFPQDEALLEQFKESKDNYLAISETITEAIFRLNEDFTIIFANSGVKNTFGFERDEIINKNISTLFPKEVFNKYREEFKKYFIVDDQDRSALGLNHSIELLGVTKHRGVVPMELSFGNSRDLSSRTIICIVRDISHQKTMERRLRHLAFHDKLTGLSNRDLFNEDMKAFFKEPNLAQGKKAALFFLDLDGFKHINDTLGHSAGDELLVETAKRIRVCLRDADTAYRFGGDEFVVFIPEIGGNQQAVIVADRILAAIRESYEVTTDSQKRTRVEIGVSIGVAMMPDHGKEAAAITKSADIAMYCSKEGGKNRITVYDESLNTKSNISWRLEQDIRMGLVKGEFDLNYQPIVTPEGKVLGAEALLRWNQGGANIVAPSTYIHVAEENGAIIPLGAWVLRRACFDLGRLSHAGFKKMYFSVNISGRQFDQPDFVSTLCDTIDKAGIDAGNLNLEITETMVMKNADDAIRKILEIKRRYPGIMLSIDDFGTGYSSLSYLSRLPVDILKIDISFVRALHEEHNQKIVNMILSLAGSLGISVVVEGIETAAQRSYFRERGCYGMQGFLFMKALPIDDLIRSFDAIRTSSLDSPR